MSYQTSSERWRALTLRDPVSHSSFIYAVLTTKIYCRPTCSARLARRANVTFFDTPVQAREAGFRACKRCKPDAAVEAIGGKEKLAKDARREIERTVEEGEAGGDVTLAELAAALGVSRRYLHKVFSESVGCTPKQYAVSLKQMRRMQSRGGGSGPPFGSAALHMDAVDFSRGLAGVDGELDVLMEHYYSPSSYEGIDLHIDLTGMEGDSSLSVSPAASSETGPQSFDDEMYQEFLAWP